MNEYEVFKVHSKGASKNSFHLSQRKRHFVRVFLKNSKKIFWTWFQRDCNKHKKSPHSSFSECGERKHDDLWNLFWGNCVCQHSSVKVIVLRRQANHNAVPTNTNRKTNQTSVFRGPANSLLTVYPVQHRMRHHIGKQLRL